MDSHFHRTYYFLLPNLDAGGAERVTITIARLLKRDYKQVEFINLGNPSGEMLSWLTPEFTLHSFGCKRVLSALPKLCRFMKQHPDGCYFSSLEYVSLIGLVAARFAHKDFIVRIPNMPRNNLYKGIDGIKLHIIKSINRFLLPRAKCIIAQNEEMRTQVLDFYGLPAGKVVAINNPVDQEYIIKSAEDSPNPYTHQGTVFLAAGTLDYRKGFDILIKAWPKVKKAIPDAGLYIIGRDNTSCAQGIKEEAAKCKDITFLGFRNNPYPYFKHCDVFVLPSRMEGFPNVVLEAMCFNKPVACTACVNVIKDIIKPAINGYYCDVEDPDALADAMIKASRLKGINNTYSLFDKEKLLEVFD